MRAPRFSTSGGGAPTTTSAGAVRLTNARVETSEYVTVQGLRSGAATTGGRAPNQIDLVRWTQITERNEFDLFIFRVSSPSAAGTSAVAVIYTESPTTGAPDALVWYSGELPTDVAADVSTTFTAGTWVMAAYRSGNNFKPAPMRRFWCGLHYESNPSVQMIGAASSDAIGFDAATGFGTTTTITRAYRNLAYSTNPPNPCGAVTYDTNVATPIIGLRPVV